MYIMYILEETIIYSYIYIYIYVHILARRARPHALNGGQERAVSYIAYSASAL